MEPHEGPGNKFRGPDPHDNASRDVDEPDIPDYVENTPPEEPPPNAQIPSKPKKVKYDKDPYWTK